MKLGGSSSHPRGKGRQAVHVGNAGQTEVRAGGPGQVSGSGGPGACPQVRVGGGIPESGHMGEGSERRGRQPRRNCGGGTAQGGLRAAFLTCCCHPGGPGRGRGGRGSEGDVHFRCLQAPLKPICSQKPFWKVCPGAQGAGKGLQCTARCRTPRLRRCGVRKAVSENLRHGKIHCKFRGASWDVMVSWGLSHMKWQHKVFWECLPGQHLFCYKWPDIV